MFTSVCKHCHKVFRAPIRTLCCKECRSLDENNFDDIEKYLKMYPNSNAMQISEELGINAYVILKYMEEGRLLVSRGTFSRLSDEE